METEILTGNKEMIGRISAEWVELCEEGASNDPFLRPEWFSAFVENFETEIELITVRHEDKLRAVLPLVTKRGRLHGIPVRKLQAVFNLNTQRFDLVHGADESERNAVVRVVWNAIRDSGRWTTFEARLVKKDSWLSDVLDLAEKENYLTGIWPMDGAPFITLHGSDDTDRAIVDFFKGPRKHLGQELNRRLRRLNELGTVEFVKTNDCTPEILRTYFELEAKGWKGRGGTAVANDPQAARMHNDFAQKISANRSLHSYQLKLDGKTIAMSLNIAFGREAIHWKTSYDEDYARYSPGNLLFRVFLTDCINNKSAQIDFLSPATPNKRVWASGEHEHVALYIFRPGVFGSLLWYWKFSIIGGLRFLRTKPAVKMVPAHLEK